MTEAALIVIGFWLGVAVARWHGDWHGKECPRHVHTFGNWKQAELTVTQFGLTSEATGQERICDSCGWTEMKTL